MIRTIDKELSRAQEFARNRTSPNDIKSCLNISRASEKNKSENRPFLKKRPLLYVPAGKAKGKESMGEASTPVKGFKSQQKTSELHYHYD
eukprot:3080665-Amphidinium_carterae.1